MKVTIEGVEYEIGKLDALRQYHLVRKLAPVLAVMIGSFSKENVESMDMGALADALAKMDMETSDFILFTCLSVVKRHDKGVWAPVSTGKQLMYADMNAAVLFNIQKEVVQENLANFFTGAPPLESAAKA